MCWVEDSRLCQKPEKENVGNDKRIEKLFLEFRVFSVTQVKSKWTTLRWNLPRPASKSSASLRITAIPSRDDNAWPHGEDAGRNAKEKKIKQPVTTRNLTRLLDLET